MKYKLLKDTPTIKAGAVFEKLSVPYEAYFYRGSRKYEYTIEEVETSPDWFEPVIERFRHSEHGCFFIVDMIGDALLTTDAKDKDDDDLFKYGNYFKTKEQAEEASRRIKKVLMDYHAEIGE